MADFQLFPQISGIYWSKWMSEEFRADSLDACIAQCFWRNDSDCLALAYVEAESKCYLGHPQNNKGHKYITSAVGVLYTQTGTKLDIIQGLKVRIMSVVIYE